VSGVTRATVAFLKYVAEACYHGEIEGTHYYKLGWRRGVREARTFRALQCLSGQTVLRVVEREDPALGESHVGEIYREETLTNMVAQTTRPRVIGPRSYLMPPN
jgi:hypothetical protein